MATKIKPLGEKCQSMTISLTPAIVNQVDALVNVRQSRSYIVRQALTEYLDRQAA